MNVILENDTYCWFCHLLWPLQREKSQKNLVSCSKNESYREKMLPKTDCPVPTKIGNTRRPSTFTTPVHIVFKFQLEQ